MEKQIVEATFTTESGNNIYFSFAVEINSEGDVFMPTEDGIGIEDKIKEKLEAIYKVENF